MVLINVREASDEIRRDVDKKQKVIQFDAYMRQVEQDLLARELAIRKEMLLVEKTFKDLRQVCDNIRTDITYCRVAASVYFGFKLMEQIETIDQVIDMQSHVDGECDDN